jgi:hypothetical protein
MSYAASDAEAYESEGFESEASGEYGEANRRRLPRTASGRGLAPMPQSQLSKNYVTYSALRQAMDKSARRSRPTPRRSAMSAPS